jgi:site-specific DNA-methyltransferase (adenine-specific)
MAGYIPDSKTDLWATPQKLFNELHEEFAFTLDVAADESNHKCAWYFTEEQNGLDQDWSGGRVWCNPPYGRIIADFVKKGYDAVRSGKCPLAVYLVPARTDTKWFHEYVLTAVAEGWAEIRFVKGRIKFGDAKVGAPFPSIVIVFVSPVE